MNWARARGRTTAPADATPVGTAPVLVMARPPGTGADGRGSGPGPGGARPSGDRDQDGRCREPGQSVEGPARRASGPGSWLLLDGADGALRGGGGRCAGPPSSAPARLGPPGLSEW